MEQFEQLLTCCVCLDRYRNPKLLPCQHSFCMEPCMDGLIDYVKRQVKCPECRAEHRIPYQGVQGFPTNVTLQRFLELHIEITGELPDPTSGQTMERCNVCSEKAYCALCVHCDKKICPDCKGAHMDILRREINRINNQIRRGLHRLKEVLAVVEKNTQNLQNNCGSVSEEIDEIYRRCQKALKDRTDFLRSEMDKYLSTELKNVVTMKENLELEIQNIQSNSDLAEKFMSESSVEWDDCELMDTKEIFLRTVDFIRNFDCETTDYSRKVRFIMNIDPNKLIMEVSSYGDLKLPTDPVGTSQSQSALLQPPSGPGLMRSKSDHRLAAQFRQQEAQGWNPDEEPLLGGRKFGERPVKPPQEKERYGNESRYGRGNDYDYDDEPSNRSAKGRFRSRFARNHQLDNDSDNESKQVRFNEKDDKSNRVTSTEDVAKGPLSGIFRLMDSPRVMKRLQDSEKGKVKKAAPAVTPAMPKPSPLAVKPKVATSRQLSEDDEIAKIKRQNKGASTSSTVTPASPVATEPERPAAERVSALKGRVTAAAAASASDDSDSTPSSPTRRTPANVEDTFPPFRYTSRFLNKSKSTAVVAPEDEGDDSDSRLGSNRSRFTALQDRRNRLARSRSSHNFGNDDEDDEPVSPTTSSPSAYLASRYGAGSSLASQPADLSRSRSTHALKSREPSPDRSTGTDKDGAALSSWARYLKNKYGNRNAKDSKDTPSSTLSATSSSLSSPSTSASSSSAAARRLSLGLPLRQTDILSSDDDSKNGVGSPTSPTAAVVGIPGAAGMSPRTQYLQKRRQLFQIGGRGSEPGSFTWPRGIAVGPDNSIVVADSSNHRVQVFDSNGIFVKEFGQYGNGDGEFDCLAGVAVNRIGQFIIADRYNHRIQVLDPSGRFLRSFGSQGTADGKFNYPWGITTDALGFIYVCDKENHRIQVFQSDGTFIGKFGSGGKEEGQLEHPHYIAVSNTNRVIVSDSNNHRIQIFDVNGRVLTAFGGEGSDEGQFKFPRGVAVDDQGYICVADSGNNRIQIFHPDGSFLRAFGSWGSGDAEFKGLEGVAIMSNGNILVCDRENHRVQVF
ncbi:RING finger protein nhl-1 isoform X3 [Toxorhynchites rutilus septentrionalis]|uniref:RING finger protein nhl-1 isoform X3 n=1 Tax=Toxorhynchites rutilus septentrionalis TaxID=329112 RepID=UPI00247839B5|nr:RING finger protein nhl-1 isoform X3 [Toxorhynchites rutilus septentrionalis]